MNRTEGSPLGPLRRSGVRRERHVVLLWVLWVRRICTFGDDITIWRMIFPLSVLFHSIFTFEYFWGPKQFPTGLGSWQLQRPRSMKDGFLYTSCKPPKESWSSVVEEAARSESCCGVWDALVCLDCFTYSHLFPSKKNPSHPLLFCPVKSLTEEISVQPHTF